jgi:hypothetical protein
MPEGKMKFKIKTLREIWESLERCGKMQSQYDKDGKLIKDTEVKLKFAYAISKNIGFVKPEIEALAPLDRIINEYNNEMITSIKCTPEKYSLVRENYKDRIKEHEDKNQEEREIDTWKIPAASIPKNILGVDLAAMAHLIDGQIED